MGLFKDILLAIQDCSGFTILITVDPDQLCVDAED